MRVAGVKKGVRPASGVQERVRPAVGVESVMSASGVERMKPVAGVKVKGEASCRS